jgi:hypothetical protein
MVDPYTGRWTVTVVDGHIRADHDGDGDPETLASWLRQLISGAQATEGVRRHAAKHPRVKSSRGDIHPIVGQLRQIREQRGISLRAVGEAMARDASGIGDLERGVSRPRVDTLDAWAFVLGQDLTLTPRSKGADQ